jgi:hypothetical protein
MIENYTIHYLLSRYPFSAGDVSLSRKAWFASLCTTVKMCGLFTNIGLIAWAALIKFKDLLAKWRAAGVASGVPTPSTVLKAE